MRCLKHAIARLLGLQTKPLDSPAQLTPIAGPALQEPTQPRGNKRSAPATKRPRQSSPAQPRSPKKPKTAKSTTAALKGSSKKQKPAPTAKSPSTRGSSTQTRASKTRQHAK